MFVGHFHGNNMKLRLIHQKANHFQMYMNRARALSFLTSPEQILLDGVTETEARLKCLQQQSLQPMDGNVDVVSGM